MRLRQLNIKDAPLMLEWMHDKNVTSFLYNDFASKNIDDCVEFINSSFQCEENVHLAIVSDEDEYMGTVSLKNIDKVNNRAEFAITIRKKAMGHGYSWFGMNQIIKKGFEEMGLELIYWCVSKSNERAVKFYKKHHFEECDYLDNQLISQYKNMSGLVWFAVEREKFFSNSYYRKSSIFNILDLKTISSGNSGQLSFIEGLKDIPFAIRRVYYITGVNEGIRRGFHAHKKLKQLIFCPYGKITLLLDNGANKEEITLDSCNIGVIIDKPLWREMVWLEKDSVLCVLASDYYDENDYIRDYSVFLDYIQKDGN